tara:strand:- start:689 stop:1096 length:408 start_codon:yes stop_codon:yes gene_type:complete
MKSRSFDSFESVILFVIYIALQDKKFSEEEKSELLIDIPLIKKYYFDCYGEFIKFDAVEQIKKLEEQIKNNNFLFDQKVSKKEEKFINNILKESQTRTLALLIARHVAESDGFAIKEKKKYNFWLKSFAQLEFKL